VVHLYATVGPASTTVSAVAAAAGVQRLTVYRHLGGERGLVAAAGRELDRSAPPPDPREWATVDDPIDRLLAACEALFDYYAVNEALLANLLRDETIAPGLARLTAVYRAMVDDAVVVLARGWTEDHERATVVRAALRLAVGFPTWRTLARDGGLRADDAIDVLVATIEAAAEPLA
jgi:AcrR family transcriptional regulator